MTLSTGSRRRRLWELPAAAHPLLLGLLLRPEQLRRTLQDAIGRLHSARCLMRGAEVDVLFSAVHDMASRNAVSEAVHRLLDARCAVAIKRLAPLREDEALRAAWQQALAQGDVPEMFWALVTHCCGEALQEAAAYDLQCWHFARVRAGLAQDRMRQALQAEHDRLVTELAQAREQVARAHADAAARAEQAAAGLIALRGETARLQGLLAAALQPPVEAPGPWAPPAQRPAARPLQAPLKAPLPAAAPPAPVEMIVAPLPPDIAGRNVLCVGGVRSALQRYRAVVEARGGRFLHHDGGIEDSVQRLNHQLQAADLVVCQAGCLNHEAYQSVKTHCKRNGKTCLYLERPSVSRFARSLGVAA